MGAVDLSILILLSAGSGQDLVPGNPETQESHLQRVEQPLRVFVLFVEQQQHRQQQQQLQGP